VGSARGAGGRGAGLTRPGGNMTGVMLFIVEVGAKRLELLGELIPQARAIGGLFNPGLPTADPQMKEVEAAARTLGLELHIAKASQEPEVGAARAAHVPQPSAPC